MLDLLAVTVVVVLVVIAMIAMLQGCPKVTIILNLILLEKYKS